MKIAVNLFILVFLATASVACKDSKKPLTKETKTELVDSSQPDLKKACCAAKEAKCLSKKMTVKTVPNARLLLRNAN